jgi:hypothetical protein
MLDQAALSQHTCMHCASVPTVLITRGRESAKSLEVCTRKSSQSASRDESAMKLDACNCPYTAYTCFARSPRVDLVVDR